MILITGADGFVRFCLARELPIAPVSSLLS
jgi:hypothetical protein